MVVAGRAACVALVPRLPLTAVCGLSRLCAHRVAVLSDPEKKARLDRGEALDEDDGDDFDGFHGGVDVEELFAMMFGGGMGGIHMGGMGGMGMGGMPFFMSGGGGMFGMDIDEEEVGGVEEDGQCDGCRAGGRLGGL